MTRYILFIIKMSDENRGVPKRRGLGRGFARHGNYLAPRGWYDTYLHPLVSPSAFPVAPIPLLLFTQLS